MKTARSIGILPCLAFAVLVSGASILLAAQNPPRIAAIDDSRVKLSHTTPSRANSTIDAGPLDPGFRMERMLLVLGPSDEMQRPMRTFLDGLHDKKSGRYHKWLTPDQFGERFGPAQADVDKITAWLQQQGFDGVKAAPGRSHIEFSGSAQLVGRAFQTEMRAYQMGSETHVANASDISIPAALSGIVRGVRLHNFSFARPALAGMSAVKRDANGHLVRVDPEFAPPVGLHLLAPGDFAKIYDLDPLYKEGVDGSGVTIAIVARSNVSLADVETFRQAFNLPLNDPNIIVNGTDPGNLGGAETIEASLDTEWAGAVAPGATVDLVVSSSTGTTDGIVLSAAYIVDNNLADIMTMSFESCEQKVDTDNALFNALWQQASAQGISVFVATGDQGAADCDPNALSANPAQGGLSVNGLASTPFNTAVGGTEFNENGNDSTFWNLDHKQNELGQVSNLGYIPEMVWNESCDPTKSSCIGNLYSFAAGGGGVSTLYSKPSWQSLGVTGVPHDNQRDLPDVSLSASAHDAYLICAGELGVFPCTTSGSGDQTVLLTAGAVGGTSAASPSFAGIMALVDQKQGGRQGLANYVLYKLAAGETLVDCNASNRTDPTTPPLPACIFNDITQGNNGVPGNDVLTGTVQPGDVDGQLGYNALPGYDSASGLGSANAVNLVNAWNSATFLGSTTTLSATTSASIQHGQAISFSVGVQPLSGNGAPTGEVGLIAQNALPSQSGVGGGTLTKGAFAGPVNSLPGGQYNVIAHYGGDGTFGGSDSNPIAVTVTPETSTVAIIGFDQNGVPTPSPLSFGYGDPFTIGARVTSASGIGTASGTVTLFDGGVQIAQLRLDNSGFTRAVNCTIDGTFCLSPLSQHTITASYSGDGSFNSSTSQPFVYKIVKGAPIGSQAFDLIGPSVLIDLSFFQSSLQVKPTGTVTVSDNFNGQSTVLASAPLAGVFQFFGPFNLASGTHSITTQYTGDSNYLPFSFPPEPIIVPPATLLATVATVAPVTTPTALGQPASFRVTVTSSKSGVTPTGIVFVVSGAAVPGNSQTPLVNGSATIQTVMPNIGPSVVAVYGGDSIFAPSTSAPVAVTVAKATPVLAVNPNVNTVRTGDQVTVTATVTPPAGAVQPFGTVQFFDALNGGSAIPFGAPHLLPSNDLLPGATAVAIRPALALGTHVFSAEYSGDTNYNSVALSNPTTINVVSQSTQTTIKLLTSPTVVGQMATFGVTVSPVQSQAAPTGQVVLTSGGAFDLNQPVALVNGSANVQIPVPSSAPNVFARYLGDSAFAPSLSTPISIVVTRATLPVVLSSDIQTANLGDTVNVAVSATPPPGTLNPTGTIQLFDAFNGGQAAPFGQPQPVPFFTQGKAAVLFPETLSLGTHIFTAAYSGDSNYNAIPAASSASVTITVSHFVFQFTAPNGNSQTISSGQTATYNILLGANGFNGNISFACAGAPSGMSCTVNPNPASLTGTNTVSLTVTVAPAQHSRLWPTDGQRLQLGFVAVLALALWGVRIRPGPRRLRLAITVLCLVGGLNGCGGGGGQPPPQTPTPSPAVSTIVVTGTGGTTTNSISLTLTVNN